MKMIILRLMLLFAGLYAGAVAAQEVKGVVKDQAGSEMPGVTVQVVGTTSGVVTDIDGKFTIQVPDVKTAALKFSFVGMKTQEIKLNGRTSLNVVLQEEATDLDEVVVVGYGTMRKKDVTGSVSTVSGEVLQKVPVANTAEALTGRLPGVQVTSTDGSPDAEMLIRVRGGGSVTGDNTPLYIVDGFPVSSINDVALNDVEDISVLKDAAATAIYGAQGANGVVIITTKSAQGGKTRITYNGFLQMKHLANRLDVLDPYEYVMYNYEKAVLNKSVSSFEGNFGLWKDLDLYKYQDAIDWQDDMFGANVLSQKHSLNVTGGTDKTKFMVSGNYDKNSGLMKGNDYNRLSLNFKLNHELYSFLKLDLNVRMSDTQVNGSGTSGDKYKVRTSDALTGMAVRGFDEFKEVNLDEMTEEERDEYIRSHMSLTERAAEHWRKKEDRMFYMAGAVNWDILKGLTYRAEFGYQYGFNENKQWWGKTTNNASEKGGLPLLNWNKRNSHKLRFAHTLKYAKTFGDHRFDIMAGQELVISGSNNNQMNAFGFSVDLTAEQCFANTQLGTVTPEVKSSVSADDKLSSFFGRLNYSYKDRYLATVTFRADGSSKFAPGNQWGYFPAAALAWRISEEDFMKGQDILSNLKLRVSYGTVGNNRIGSTLYKMDYKVTNSKTYGVGDTPNVFYEANNKQLANPNLKWETTITRNIGLDFGLWHERLNGTIEGYWNSTKDLLLNSKIVAPGYTEQYQNIGKTSNKGVEISLNGRIVEKEKWSLGANFNIGINRSKVDKLADGDYQEYSSGWAGTDLKGYYDYRVEVGQPVGLIYGFVTDGYYKTTDFEYWTPTGYKLKDGVPDAGSMLGGKIGVRPGTIKLKDLSGPDGVPDGKIDEDHDRQIIGKTAPKFFGGFGFDAQAYGFDITLMFSYVYGNKVYNATKIAATQQYRNSDNNLMGFMNRNNSYTYLDANGSLVTDLATLAAMNEGENAKAYWSPHSFGNAVVIPHTWAVEDGSFLRLQNITIGYTVPQRLTRKFACERLRAFCTLNNVWCWTKYSGYDPEVSSAGRNSSYNALTPGVDYSAYPKSFGMTFGLDIAF